jgi:predicted AlkP superfamily pyrophosphatase or phosphodiesterase
VSRASLAALLLVATALAGCPRAHTETTSRAPHGDSATRAWPRPAPLVVVVVYDQLSSAMLERYAPLLDEDGLLRATMASGTTAWRVRYPYAPTYTAPGHAAIFSGAPPARSGVPGNKLWDRARNKKISAVDDAEHAVFGHDGAFASPRILEVSTVGDVLRDVTGDRAHVAALSLKDRSAVLPAGHRADLALWFDAEARGFTTSTAYAPSLPAWVAAWTSAHAIDPSTAVWEAQDPARLTRVLGPDDAPGEGDWDGYGRVFPHRPSSSSEPYEAYLATPMAGDALLALAEQAALELSLGRDPTPDLLAISLSNIDYVGHTFGPDSWEYVDNLVRTDRAAGGLLRELRQRGEVSVLLTADHGGASLPERARGAGRPAFRVLPADVKARAEAACDAALGAGDWVDAFVQPLVYLSASARLPANRDRAVAAVREALRTMDGVHATFDVRDAERLRASADPLERAVGLGIPATPPGELFVVPAEYSVIDEEVPAGAGTSHGSPWDYDIYVPVVFAGPGVAHGETREVADEGRVAPTIAGLLGITAEWVARCERESRPAPTPLPGAPALPEARAED